MKEFPRGNVENHRDSLVERQRKRGGGGGRSGAERREKTFLGPCEKDSGLLEKTGPTGTVEK